MEFPNNWQRKQMYITCDSNQVYKSWNINITNVTILLVLGLYELVSDKKPYLVIYKNVL